MSNPMGFGAPRVSVGYPHHLAQVKVGAADALMAWQRAQVGAGKTTEKLKATNDEGRFGVDPHPTEYLVEYVPVKHDNTLVARLATMTSLEQSGPFIRVTVRRYTGLPWHMHTDPRIAPMVSLVESLEVMYYPQLASTMTQVNASIDMWAPDDLYNQRMSQLMSNLTSGLMSTMDGAVRRELSDTMPPPHVLMAKFTEWQQDLVEMRLFGVLNATNRRDVFGTFASDILTMFDAARSIFNIPAAASRYTLVAPKIPFFDSGVAPIQITALQTRNELEFPLNMFNASLTVDGATTVHAISITEQPATTTTTIQLGASQVPLLLYGRLDDEAGDAWNRVQALSFYANLPKTASAVGVVSDHHATRIIRTPQAMMNSGLFVNVEEGHPVDRFVPIFPRIQDNDKLGLAHLDGSGGERMRLCTSLGVTVYQKEFVTYLKHLVSALKRSGVHTCDQLAGRLRVASNGWLAVAGEVSSNKAATNAAFELFGGTFRNQGQLTLQHDPETNNVVWKTDNEANSPILSGTDVIGGEKAGFPVLLNATKVAAWLRPSIVAATKIATLVDPSNTAFVQLGGNSVKRAKAASLLHVWREWPLLLLAVNEAAARIPTPVDLMAHPNFERWADDLYTSVMNGSFWNTVFASPLATAKNNAAGGRDVVLGHAMTGRLTPDERHGLSAVDAPSIFSTGNEGPDDAVHALGRKLTALFGLAFPDFAAAAAAAGAIAHGNPAELLAVLFGATVGSFEDTTAGRGQMMFAHAADFLSFQQDDVLDMSKLQLGDWGMAATLAMLPTCEAVFEMFAQFVPGSWIDLKVIFSINASVSPVFYIPEGSINIPITNYEMRKEPRALWVRQETIGGFIRFFAINQRNAGVIMPNAYIHGAGPVTGICTPQSFQCDRSQPGSAEFNHFVVPADLLKSTGEGISRFVKPDASTSPARATLWNALIAGSNIDATMAKEKIEGIEFVPHTIMPLTYETHYSDGRPPAKFIGVDTATYL